MPTISCTYNTIISLVSSWITSNCINVSNYAGLPACFKADFSQVYYPPHTWTQVLGGACTYIPAATVYITRSVPQVSASTVTSQLNSFITSINVNKNQQISAVDFINFINNIFSFCSTKIYYTSSYFSSTNYLAYNSNNTTFVYKQVYKGAGDDKLITSEDATNLINMLFSVMKASFRQIPCTYGFSFNG